MNHPSAQYLISWDDFTKVDMRVGTIVQAEIFEKARQPAYKIWVDFGELGVKKQTPPYLQKKSKCGDAQGYFNK